MTRRVQKTTAPVMQHHGKKEARANGYCIWEYTGAAWEMKKDCTVPGSVPAGRPQIDGRFRGQLRVVPSVKMA